MHPSLRPLLSLAGLALFFSACSGSPTATLPAGSTPEASAMASPVAPAIESPAASPRPTDAPSPEPSPTHTAAPSATPTPIPDPAEAPAVRYRFQVSLDYDAHTAEVEQYVEYTNSTADALPTLELMVQPAAYPGAFRLLSSSSPTGELQVTQTGSTLTLKPPAVLEPGAVLSFTLKYHLALPVLETALKKGPVPFGYTTNQTNLVDWYPFIPALDSEGNWRIHPGHEYGEHLVYQTAAYEIDLDVSGNWAQLFVAASAPAEMRSSSYHYEMPAARSFAVTVSHLYESLTQDLNGVTVTAISFPIHKAANQAALKTTVEALQLYTELFGPYPHPQLTVVEADFLDGMEYDGLYFLSRGFYNLYSGTPGEYLVAIAAHETAHQWWYARVGNDQALEPWLDEALCTYSEKLYFERYSPEGLKWWWEYRVAYYNPQGWVDVQIYPPAGKRQTYNQYRDAVYLRGAQFLEELRKQVGDEAFFSFLQGYTQKYNNQVAASDDFFALLKEHTDVDFSPLAASFFETP